MNTSQLPITFSPRAKLILDEVESLYGSEVQWEERPDLEGDLCALSNTPFPDVLYKNQSVLNEGACVHELLHLKLRKLGFPHCAKKDPEENNNWRDQTVTMLDNIFQHAIIFPMLVNLGYDPYGAEEIGTKGQLRTVSGKEFQSPESHSSLRSLLALLYARAHLDCRSSDTLGVCDAVFFPPAFANCKLAGAKIIEIVREYAKYDINSFRVGLDKSLDSLQETNFIKLVTVTTNIL